MRIILREGGQDLVNFNISQLQEIHFALEVIVMRVGVVHDVEMGHAVLLQVGPEALPVGAGAAVDHHELAAALDGDGLVAHFLIEGDLEQVPLVPVGGLFLPAVIHLRRGGGRQQHAEEQGGGEGAQARLDLHGISFRGVTNSD